MFKSDVPRFYFLNRFTCQMDGKAAEAITSESYPWGKAVMGPGDELFKVF